MKTVPTLLAIAAIALVLPGCGSSSKSSGTRGYAGTGQAVDNVCKGADAKVKALSSQLTGSASHDAPILDQLVSQLDKSFGDLKAIKPDPKLKATFDQY